MTRSFRSELHVHVGVNVRAGMRSALQTCHCKSKMNRGSAVSCDSIATNATWKKVLSKHEALCSIVDRDNLTLLESLLALARRPINTRESTRKLVRIQPKANPDKRAVTQFCETCSVNP